ncbi:MAG: glycosyltransferase [Acidobacteria bacterium]|nr:glycosyltransferase [Acidobacteriota bacterium]
MAARLSVIIPDFNHTRYLDGAIQSVLDQTEPPGEIIVVDDGSTDGCEAAVRTYGERVRYLYQENQGLAAARNTGIRAAGGELVGLLDADDRWRPQFCAEMTRVADANPGAAAYYCRAQTMDERGTPLPQVLGGPPVPAGELFQRLLRANFIIPSTVVLRREVVMAAGLFDAGLRSCEDWDLWLRLLPEHAIVGHDACLVDYRVHGSSLSGDPQAMQRWARTVIEKRFGAGDEPREAWPPEKRRAFGGLYRYCAISTVQRQMDWTKAAGFLRTALEIDPTLAEDLDLFYDLALAGQPVGYRGAAAAPLTEHVRPFTDAIESVLGSLEDRGTRARGAGTAYKALGLVAYNAGHYAMSRRFLTRALVRDARLWGDTLVVGDLVKSFVRGWLPGRAAARAGAAGA